MSMKMVAYRTPEVFSSIKATKYLKKQNKTQKPVRINLFGIWKLTKNETLLKEIEEDTNNGKIVHAHGLKEYC